MNTTNAYAHCGLKPGHYKIMSYEGLRNYRHLLAWNARESLDTNKSDAVMRSRRFFPSRERSSVLLLAIMINSQPQKNRQNSGEKTRQHSTRTDNVSPRWRGTGEQDEAFPPHQLPWGVFVTWSAHVLLAQKQKLKIDFNFQFSISNF